VSRDDFWRHFLGTVERDLREKVPTESGRGHTTRRIGAEEVDLVVEISPDKLLRALGHKAAESSKGVSSLRGGAVRVRVVARRPVKP